jgi:predicted GIY-YIG superfamily endonuclease
MAKKAAVNAEMTAYIYGLRDKKSKLYFYIGSTRKTPKARLGQHISKAKTYQHTDRFIAAALKIGFDNIVVDVIETVTEAIRFIREYEYVNWYRALGHPLTNIIYSIEDERRYFRQSRTNSLRSLSAFDFVRMLNIAEYDYPPSGDRIVDKLKGGILKMFERFPDDVRSAGRRVLRGDKTALERMERLIGSVTNAA